MMDDEVIHKNASAIRPTSDDIGDDTAAAQLDPAATWDNRRALFPTYHWDERTTTTVCKVGRPPALINRQVNNRNTTWAYGLELFEPAYWFWSTMKWSDTASNGISWLELATDFCVKLISTFESALQSGAPIGTL